MKNQHSITLAVVGLLGLLVVHAAASLQEGKSFPEGIEVGAAYASSSECSQNPPSNGQAALYVRDNEVFACSASGTEQSLLPASSSVIGSTSGNPAPSCLHIHEANAGNAPSGPYWIKPSAYTGSPVRLYCDMDTDDGGWTLVAKHRTGYACSQAFLGNTGYACMSGSMTTCANEELSHVTYGSFAARAPKDIINHILRREKGRIRYWRGTTNYLFYEGIKAPVNMADGLYKFSRSSPTFVGNLNSEFRLHSSYSDMVSDWNRWSFCNYEDQSNDGVGFPRDCGPSGSVGSRWIAVDSCTSAGGDIMIWVQ